MLGGVALAEILEVKMNPFGKLVDTWCEDYYDHTTSKNFIAYTEGERHLGDARVNIDTCYEEDIYVGYRYFETFQKPYIYPFGYGLSYTQFDRKSEGINYF